MRERWPYIVVVLTVAISSLGTGLIPPVMPGLLLEMGVPALSEAAVMTLTFASETRSDAARFNAAPRAMAALLVLIGPVLRGTSTPRVERGNQEI